MNGGPISFSQLLDSLEPLVGPVSPSKPLAPLEAIGAPVSLSQRFDLLEVIGEPISSSWPQVLLAANRALESPSDRCSRRDFQINLI